VTVEPGCAAVEAGEWEKTYFWLKLLLPVQRSCDIIISIYTKNTLSADAFLPWNHNGRSKL